MEKVKDLNYWKNNCEEDYLHTPISVLRYITELEKEVESKINFTDSSLELKEGYTQDFVDYVDKFFKYRPKVYDWVSKDGKREFTHKGLCKMYEKAMNESPLIT